MLTKADLVIKKRSLKRGTVNIGGAGGIEMIFTVLRLFLLACEFETIGLSLKEKIYIRHWHRPKVFFGILGAITVELKFSN